jgi:aspartate-semialdehyde dehydrogenase
VGKEIVGVLEKRGAYRMGLRAFPFSARGALAAMRPPIDLLSSPSCCTPNCVCRAGFPVAELRLFGSARSAGTKVQTKFGEVTIEDFSVEEARKMDVVFVSVSGDFSLEYCEKMAEGEDGCVVIDNSSAFRMKEGFALCVPEINADAAKKSNKKVIANPNCTTAIGIMALWPLHQKYGLKKVLMSTYQAASGAGQEGMDELFNGAKMVTSGEKAVADNKIFAYPLAFNLIPHIDVFQDNLYTKEEMKVTWECQKIMDLPNLPVSCTAVRIPTLRAHAETIVIETEKPINPDEVNASSTRALLLKLEQAHCGWWENPDWLVAITRTHQ